jgi:glycosyltransferase involved in cell wall biosynthesis
MEFPLVSVVIITYNHKNFISQCIEGVLSQQTNFLYEIIIGEDESSDGTREICQNYANRCPEKIQLLLRSRIDVIYIDDKPTGIFNFIETLKAATGKYIAICEGDDYWTSSDKLQNQVDFLEANPDYNLCFHNAIVKHEDEHKAETVFRNLESNKLQKNKEVYDMDDLISEEPLIPTASLLFRKTTPFIFPKWFSTIMNTDMALFIHTCGNGRIKYFDECWSVYRKHKGGVSNFITGDFKHSSRMKMFLLQMKYYQGGYRESFTKNISQHLINHKMLYGMSQPDQWVV